MTGNRDDLLKSCARPQVVYRTAAEIDEDRKSYWDCVASFALEDAEPDDFGKIVTLEEIRGEITEEQCTGILNRQYPEETARIEAKIAQLRHAGLSWKDL